MKQDYCFDCGIPIPLNTQKELWIDEILVCIPCIKLRHPNKIFSPFEENRGNYITIANLENKMRHIPRWNYPNKNSYKEPTPFVNDIIWNVNNGEMLVFNGKEWMATKITNTTSPLLRKFTIVESKSINGKVLPSLPYQRIARRVLQKEEIENAIIKLEALAKPPIIKSIDYHNIPRRTIYDPTANYDRDIDVSAVILEGDTFQ